MKISIALAALILILAAAFGWHDHERLAGIRANHAALVAEAAALGISINPADSNGRPLVTRHAEREDKQAAAKDAAARFIAFAREMEGRMNQGESPDEATQKRMIEFMELMLSLDASQLKILMTEMRAAGDLKDETRQGIIAFSITMMANDHPQAALALFTESSDLFKDNRMGNHVVSMALGRWAKDDPMGALDWVRKNGDKFPDLVTEEAKSAVIYGAATKDTKLALQLMSEFNVEISLEVVDKIANNAKTPEELGIALSAFREHAASLSNPEERRQLISLALTCLVDSAAKEGFQAGSQWISNAGLSPKEIEDISSNLATSIKTAETGQWIEWFGNTFSAEKADSGIGRMIQNWTQKDYRAAGTWLASAPDGPTKQAAVRGYAETVAPYDPQAAAQWALTLPAGEKRTQTIKRIHWNWPKDDAAGAASFAQEHGLKP